MITNELLELTIKLHYSMGIEKKEIRSYEVSLWTLLDSFITVLKWSDVEQKGRIEHPKMVLDVDGTQELTFSIPMYYYRDGIRIENPNWYNTRNGNLIAGLRKIKVIFNKGDSKKEAVFEFVILNVDEIHEKDVLTCEVKCEGLAFHELGKIGYKIDLSPDGFYLKYKKWAETDGSPATEPILDLDYWCQEAGLELLPTTGFINPSRWYYTVLMNLKSFENSALPRKTNKIYEETYTTAWDSNLNPIASKSYAIKARPIEIENSNIYNITLTIAETFGVFCRYDYLHDANYHIIAKIIIFYNNYFLEDEGYFSLTYPYSAERISRTMDSTDVTTKLYVLHVDDDNTLLGYHSIMDSEANKTKEDYILNFDYLHDIGAITEELYAAIELYEKDIRKLNETLIPLLQNLATYLIKLPELLAKVALYENAKKLDLEQIDSNTALRNALDTRDKDNDGNITVTNKNPDSSIIIEDALKGNYVNLNTNRGIVVSTLKVYSTWSSANLTLNNEITNWTPVYDDYGNLISIKNIAKPSANRNRVYMTYKYNPLLYYDSIIDSWRERLGNDEANYNDYVILLGEEGTDIESSSGIYKSIKEVESAIADTTTQKNKIIKKFNEMMGPALREGYWQPESYSDYGELKVYTEDLSLEYSNDWKIENTELSAVIGWDNELFDREQKSSYEYGSNQTVKYYPCIDLSNIYSSLSGDITLYSFYFNNNYTDITGSENFDWRYLLAYAVGSLAILSFAKNMNSTEIKPVLILIGARSLTDDLLSRMKNLNTGKGGFGRIITTIENNGTTSVSIVDDHTINNALWLDMSNYEIVMPRIKFSSLELKTLGNDLIIKYNNQLLKLFEDFYINTRNTERNETYYQEYFITIKPTTLLKTKTLSANFDINYILSNANTAIYLDALEVSHENAYPKVSYEISTNILNINIINTLYNRLALLVMINDTDLKFENTFGYISHLDLDLDAPQNDEIEIKNYKTKFEDLFSAIVALTELMKRASIGTSAAISGSIPLSNAGFTNTITNNEITFNAYLDLYFTTSGTVEDKLTSLFNDAGNLLGDASRALNNVSALSSENASILAGFALTAALDLSTLVYRGEIKPTSYKPGDIWIYTDANDKELGRYTAMSYSSEDSGNSNDPFSGFARTSDGSLASIRGAMLNINTEDGIIDIIALDETSILSGNHIYIAANNGVDIVGNKFVNIGGGTINITGSVKNFTDGEGLVVTTSGGINLISTAVDYLNNVNIENSINGVINGVSTEASKVLIHPDSIRMRSATIEMLTGGTNNSEVSAITLDGDEGIILASSKSIKLFASEGTDSTANVEINPNHIFFGMNNIINNNATAIELTKDYIIMAAGVENSSSAVDNIASIVSNGITIDGSLAGIEIKNNKIGLAVGSGNGRTAIIMGSDGLVIGTRGNDTDPASNGSIVTISGNGVEIGSSGHLKVSTTNFKVNPSATDTTALFYVGTGNETDSDKYIKYSATNGLEIRGKLTAGAGSTIGGWTIGTDYIGNGNDKDCSVGMQAATGTDKAFWAGYNKNAAAGSKDKFYVTGNGYLYAADADITGTVTATSGTIGGWSLSTTTPNRLYSGTGTNYVAMDSGTGDYAFWAGNATATLAPFRVKRDGTVVIKQLLVATESGGTDTIDFTDNNSNYPLWKLYGLNVKSASVSDDGKTLTIATFSGGAVTFNKASGTVTSLEAQEGTTYDLTGNTKYAYALVKAKGDGIADFTSSVKIDITTGWSNGYTSGSTNGSSNVTLKSAVVSNVVRTGNSYTVYVNITLSNGKSYPGHSCGTYSG